MLGFGRRETPLPAHLSEPLCLLFGENKCPVSANSPQDLINMRRHSKTYRALNELAEVLGLSFDRTPPFVVGIGREDMYEKIGDVAQAAVKALRQR